MALRAFADGALFGDVTGSGPPTVLALHGWARTRADLAPVLDGLDALALDLPGFGASPPPAGPGGAAAYAQAVLPALQACAPPVVVLGHSFGGRVAVHLAARAPDVVAGLVLTGVPLVRRPGAPPPRSPLPFRLGRWLHERGLVGEDRMEALRRRYGSVDYRAARGIMREVLVRVVNETYEDQLRALRCPVELVWGGADAVVPPPVAEAATALLADGRLTVLTGVGHHVPLEAPAALRAALDRLLARRAP